MPLDSDTLVAVLRLGRFHFLLAGALIFLLGALVAISAGAAPDAARLAFGYAVLFCAQLSVSYSNDYFDAEGDRTSVPTPFSGGSKVLVERPGLRPLALRIAVGLILASLALGVAFGTVYHLPPWFMGFVVLGNLLGWYYSAPPLRLCARGLGEASTVVTAGLLMPGMGYIAATGGLDWEFAALMPATMVYGLIFIINVQVPDIDSDRLAGKVTLVSGRGREWALSATAALMALASAVFVALALAGPSLGLATDYRTVALASLVPLAFGIASAAGRRSEREAASRLVTGTVGSFFLFLVLVDGYLWASTLL